MFFRTTRELEYLIFFHKFHIRLYDENSESDYFFPSIKIRIFFSATLGIRIFFFLKKNIAPRGDNLSHNLFKLFINDLPEIVDQTCTPVTLNSLKLNCLLDVDDIVLLSETAEGLQNSLDKVSQYCKKGVWKLILIRLNH